MHGERAAIQRAVELHAGDGAEPVERVSPPPVMSVSPSRAERAAPSDELRELKAEVEAASVRLRSLLDQVRESDANATKAAVHLQERLHLGARMLRAFHSTVQRAETVQQPEPAENTPSPEPRPDGPPPETVIGELHQRMEQIADDTQRRIDALVENALDRIKGDIATRQSELLKLEQRVATMSARAETLAAMTDKAEQKLSRLSYRTARWARHAEARTAQVLRMLHGGAEAHTALAQTLRELVASPAEPLELPEDEPEPPPTAKPRATRRRATAKRKKTESAPDAPTPASVDPHAVVEPKPG